MSRRTWGLKRGWTDIRLSTPSTREDATFDGSLDFGAQCWSLHPFPRGSRGTFSATQITEPRPGTLPDDSSPSTPVSCVRTRRPSLHSQEGGGRRGRTPRTMNHRSVCPVPDSSASGPRGVGGCPCLGPRVSPADGSGGVSGGTVGRGTSTPRSRRSQRVQDGSPWDSRRGRRT